MFRDAVLVLRVFLIICISDIEARTRRLQAYVQDNLMLCRLLDLIVICL